MLVDSHCHLDRLKLEKIESGSLDQVIEEALEREISHMLCVGIDLSNAAAVKSIAEKYPQVFASVGIHPLDIKESEDYSSEAFKLSLIGAADHNKVVAIGETGLDYYYSADNKEVQQQSFTLQLQIAKELALPVIVHSRDAKQDTLDLCFYLSFSGIVTFKNAKQIQDVARQMPMDRILVETDSPYLAPTPYRGKPNFPKYTREVAEYVADLQGVPLEKFAEQTTENFFRLFNKANQITN